MKTLLKSWGPGHICSVEFTLLAEKALEEQLGVGFFTSQSDFLIKEISWENSIK
ncbi:MAG: hypothetical protein Ct9H300mP6_07020 [Gammaproteobacteria bacterium]|nr:MAG: hypothetical protein Ct9H300mP6_07020 [Gammaproteobacteria bacterium]